MPNVQIACIGRFWSESPRHPSDNNGMWDLLCRTVNSYYVLPSMEDSARPPRLAPEAETARLAALDRYHIIDSEDEELFDATVKLAATICATPIASISFIDNKRQWLKARIGYPVSEIPRDLAFCSHTILEESGRLVIEDASADARFALHPFVAKAPHIRFYAGLSLISDDGYALGTLCVMDKTARALTPEQAEALETLTAQVITQLELRRSNRRLQVLESAMEQTQDAIVIAGLPSKLQPSSGIEFANAAFTTLAGKSLDQILGQPFEEAAFLQADAKKIAHYHRAIAKGRPVDFEITLDGTEGTVRHIEMSIAPVVSDLDTMNMLLHLAVTSRQGRQPMQLTSVPKYLKRQQSNLHTMPLTIASRASIIVHFS